MAEKMMHADVTNGVQAPGGRPRVVIVGAGFGGLEAARRLAGAPVEVLLLDRTNYHLFTPLLYQVATGGLEPEEIARPVRHILRRAENVRFRVATVRGVDLERRRIETDEGAVDYDYLVLATGSATNFFGVTAPAAKGLKDLPEALALRSHLLARVEQAAWERDPERRRALLTFVVVGGGPTGVEMAGALTELLRLALPGDFPMLDFSEARVILLEAMDSILGAFRPRLRRAGLRALQRKGVNVRLRARVERVEADTVYLADGGRIEAGTLVWAAGVQAGALAGAVATQRARAGRLVVDESLRLPGHPEVFVIGDMAAFEQGDETLPMLAPVAIQQGKHVAQSIQRALDGKPPISFHYKDPGTMATIGRNQAVAQIGPVSLTGFVAWLAWLGLHLIQIIGFRNRLLVLINWAWDYLTYDRAVRLIGSPTTVTGPGQPSPALELPAADGVGAMPAAATAQRAGGWPRDTVSGDDATVAGRPGGGSQG